MARRLPDTAHTRRPWRIHAVAPDFRVEDVWELPWRGSADDFAELVTMIASSDPTRGPRAVRALLAARTKLGGLLGWDDPAAGVGSRTTTLRERLPADLRERAPDFGATPFETLYLLDDEFAAELANRTMHGVLQIGRVPDGDGGFRAQMAVLVKPNGLLGRAYMAAIKPFRYLIVYPALLRSWERAWQRRVRGRAPSHA